MEEDVVTKVEKGMLRWFGYVEWMVKITLNRACIKGLICVEMQKMNGMEVYSLCLPLREKGVIIYLYLADESV